ncbi:MAG: bifunctional alpha,alpha-trehalose-phosphate synthase (UDP-forming)/trehalose-phosphatase [Spirochaetia bacterium]
MNPVIINISNRLPVTITDSQIKQSSGGLVAAFKDVSESFPLKWFGWIGKDITDKAEQDKWKKELGKLNLFPVYMNIKEVEYFYNHFSNSSLWPILHYLSAYMEYEYEWFPIYQKINERFAKSVAEYAEENALVWIHDYQLMLLPKYLRQLRPDLKIGFFLHTPFPSSEVFRSHPNRTELLEGLLGADLIGFQTFGYLRHFRSAVLRILGVNSDMEYLYFENRAIKIGSYPIGMSWRNFEAILKSKEYKKKLSEYTEYYKDKKVVLSVERMDYTKGIRARLKAIRYFLQTYKEYRDNIVFIQVAIPSRESVKFNQEITDDIIQEIGYINGEYATITNSPIHLIHHSITQQDLAALYTRSDAALVTPLCDGMNLVAKEYIACKKNKPGMVVLSEFAGAAQELFHSQIVNPYNSVEIAQKIKESLETDKQVLIKKMNAMHKTVVKNSSQAWAMKFIQDLMATNNTPGKNENIFLEKNYAKILNRLKDTKPISLFLDYDGTLREFEKDPDKASPSPQLYNIIERLSQNPDINVYIISGRKGEDLEKWFQNYPVTLIAEHGYLVKQKDSSEWMPYIQDVQLDWKPEIQRILNTYVEQTPGSTMEMKTLSAVWHYRGVDPELAQWKANQLLIELQELTANIEVEVRSGQKIIEVCSQQVHKGAVLSKFARKEPSETYLCIGDDVTDEHMFEQNIENMISIKVGTGETKADYRLKNPKAARTFLETLGETI